jgi:hypothetical protein
LAPARVLSKVGSKRENLKKFAMFFPAVGEA